MSNPRKGKTQTSQGRMVEEKIKPNKQSESKSKSKPRQQNKKRLIKNNESSDDSKPIMKQKYPEQKDEEDEESDQDYGLAEKFQIIDQAREELGKIDQFFNKNGKQGAKSVTARKERVDVVFRCTAQNNGEVKKKLNHNIWGEADDNFLEDQTSLEENKIVETEISAKVGINLSTQVSSQSDKPQCKVNQIEQEKTQPLFSMDEELHKNSLSKELPLDTQNTQELTKSSDKELHIKEKIIEKIIHIDNTKNLDKNPLTGINFFMVGKFKLGVRQQIIGLLTDFGAKCIGTQQFRVKLQGETWLVYDEMVDQQSQDIQNITKSHANIQKFTEVDLDLHLLDKLGKNIFSLIEDQMLKKETIKQPEQRQEKLKQLQPLRQQPIIQAVASIIEEIQIPQTFGYGELKQQEVVVQKPFFGEEPRILQKTHQVAEVIKMMEQNKPKKEIFQSPPLIEIIDKTIPNSSQLWTEKYKPKSFSDCISNEQVFQELMIWLKQWGNVEQVPKFKQEYFKGQNKGAKAALLSGPPGIGKTTSVRIIAQHLGYHLLEWNASDVRSKLAIEEGVSHLKNNSTISMSGPSLFNTRTLILMDEVDGMSGSDKGGNMALINMIKDTKVPIVCICNDRYNPKIKSLSSHCLDLQFKRPDEKQVLVLLKNICLKEKIPFDLPVLEKKIKESQCDIRQLINMLQVTRIQNKMSSMNKLGNKDSAVLINIFDASKILLNYDNGARVRDLLDMYFIDHSIIPLIYQENYLYTSKNIEDISLAANSLADSDILSRRVRKNNDWSLMPQVGFLSTIYPTQMLKGSTKRKVEFTQFLGKFSSQRKQERQLKELKDALAVVSYNKGCQSIKYGYIETLSKIINKSITAGDYEKTTDILKSQNLTLNLALENIPDLLSQFPKRNTLKKLETSDKTRLNKAYKGKSDSLDQGAPKKNQKQNHQQEFKSNKINDNIEEEEEIINDSESQQEENIDGFIDGPVLKKKLKPANKEKNKKKNKKEVQKK